MSQSDIETVPGVILVKGFSGLADRLKALIESVAYAELTGRQVFIEWRDKNYSPDGADVFFRLFESPTIQPWPDSLPTTGIVPDHWTRHLDASVHDLIRLLVTRVGGHHHQVYKEIQFDVTEYEGDDPAIVTFNGARNKTDVMKRLRRLQLRALDPDAPVTPRIIRPSIARLDYPGLVKEVISDNIILRPEIRRKVDDFKDEYFGGCVIGVHVRYTDKMVNLSRVHAALIDVLNKEKNAIIFLACDNELVTNSFRNRYSNVIARNIERSSDAMGIHVPNGRNETKLQNAIDALTDAYLLAECDYLLYCRDLGFSVLPHALSNIDESRKIAYQVGSDNVLVRWQGRPPFVSVLLPFHPLDNLDRCLRQLTSQRYPAEAYDITVFGKFGRRDAKALKKRFPNLRQLRGAKAALLGALQASEGKVVAVTDSRFDHSEDWLAEGVDKIVHTPLAGLLYNGVEDGREPSQFFLLRALIEDPGLDVPVVELAPDSAWGLQATALGYRHGPILAR